MSIHTKKVEILPYDPQWRQQFQARKTDLARILQGLPILAIEHVGSTSVEGLAAKAILDIDVVLPSREVFPDVRRRLEQVKAIWESPVEKPLTGRSLWKPWHIICMSALKTTWLIGSISPSEIICEPTNRLGWPIKA